MQVKTDKKIRGGGGGRENHLLDGGGWSVKLNFFDMLAYVCSNYFGVTWS